MIRVFIGFDRNENVAYHVLSQSILEHTSLPVSITPLYLPALNFDRERDARQSTEFSFTRFLVPYLCNLEGTAIFMDCDMLVRRDLKDLLLLQDPKCAVQVVQHDYEPNPENKFFGQPQSVYPKKNWSSVMLFNCEHVDCAKLSKLTVKVAAGAFLHQFKWTDKIGELPPEWNYLVGESVPYQEDPAIVHFTRGGPYIKGFEHSQFAEEWHDMYRKTIYCKDSVL